MKVCFFSLGCDKNKTDSEKIIWYLQNKYNAEIINNVEEADIAVVNTCSFIHDAKNESISIIKELEGIKKKTKLKKIAVIGCLTKDKSVDLSEIVKSEDVVLPMDEYLYSLFDINDRMMDILSFSSSIKISDGCEKNCSYCIIPKLRGKYKSNSIDNIYNEAVKLVNKGTKEINIVAQDTLNYGLDLYKKKSIVQLVEKLSKIKNLEWIRLLYCYPEEIDDDIINLIKNNKKVLHYIDMPLQHINNRILKLMHRPTTKDKVINLINKLRKEVPDIIIRTTFIVGFPGETKEEFDELLDFIKMYKIDKVGAFAYSREKGSTSYLYEDQIAENVKQKRLKKLFDVQQKIVLETKKNYIGKIYNCIVEGYDTNKNLYVVRSYMDARDVDEVIYVKTKNKLLSGSFVDVCITGLNNIDLVGKLVCNIREPIISHHLQK